MKTYSVLVVDMVSGNHLIDVEMSFTSKKALNVWAKKEFANWTAKGHDVDIYAYETGARK